MKKVLLVVALLLLATPLFAADVTVTATQPTVAAGTDLQKVVIGYTGAVEANSIRAFALSITTDLNDNNAVFSNIRDYNTGESKKPGGGFGIFPARFRQYITPLNGTDVNSWSDANYNPLAVWGDVNAGWGINTKWMVAELGTLFVEPNSPGTSGTLFAFDVNNKDRHDCNVCIAIDQIRGGVVKKDTTGATVTLPPGGLGAPAGCIRVTYPPTCVTPANEIGVATATAEGVWTGQGFTIGTKTPVPDCAHLGLVISYSPTICTTQPAAISYSYGTTATVPNVVNQVEATALANLTAAGCPIGTRTTASSCTVASGNVISTNPVAGTVTCTPVAYVVSTGPGTQAAPGSITVPATDADGKYNVTWTAASGAASYVLEDACDAGSWKVEYSGTALTYAVKVGGGTWIYRVKALNACGVASAYTTGGNSCVVTDCLKSTTPAAELAAWKTWRYPACWCYNRQCRGDINGAISLGKPVTSTDLTLFSAAYNLTDAQLALVTNGICSDLNHSASLGKRVTSADLTIFNTYYNLATASVPCCDTAAPAGDCTLVAGDKYSYWTAP